MNRLHVACVCAALLCATDRKTSADDVGELIKAKLELAKSGYEAEIAKLKGAAKDDLKDREEKARSSGDLKLVEQFKTEREALETTGRWPKVLPKIIAQKRKTASSQLEAAFADAVRSYVKARLDDDAKATQEEATKFRAGLDEFVSSAADAGPEDGSRNLWVHSSGYFLKGLGNDWFESWDNGKQRPNLFTENRRTDEFVELRRTGDSALLRLYKDKVLMSDERRAGQLKPIYQGKWQKR